MWHTNPAHLQHASDCSQQGSNFDFSPVAKGVFFCSPFLQTHVVEEHQLQAMGDLQ